MGEAAKKWREAATDPSKLWARIRRWKSAAKKLRASVIGGLLSDQNRELREEIERLEKIVEFSDRYQADLAKTLGMSSNSHLGDIATVAGLRIERANKMADEISRLKAELAAAPHWVPVAEWVGDYGSHYVAASNGLCYDARRKGGMWFAAYAEWSLGVDVTHVLVGLNPPASNEDPRGDGDLLPESERLDRLTRECMRDEFGRMIEITRKMDEPPVCKHEKTRTVLGTPYDSHSIECVDCGCDVTHSEPVKSRKFGNCGRKNCRGVSHQVNHGYCRECQSAIDEMTDSLTVLSAKPKRDLIVAESPDGMWRVWEQKTPGDYTLVAGPFHDSEMAHAAADEIRAEEGTSNDLAGDASDIERAIRERLLQPFLGSEAEKLGAKKYQLRDGERWEYLSLLGKWETAKTPVWYRGVKYRLAKGEQHAATD